MPMPLTRWLWPKSLINPVSRMALATFAWNHRHEILRWGRTLYDQLVGRTDVSPVRALRTGSLLFVIASDEQLRNAKELRKVTMVDDDVDLEVDERWPLLPRLIEKVRSVKGVRHVSVNGTTLTAAEESVDGRRRLGGPVARLRPAAFVAIRDISSRCVTDRPLWGRTSPTSSKESPPMSATILWIIAAVLVVVGIVLLI